jgi:FlaA1/EpsC-like NDP-sugar epimerase
LVCLNWILASVEYPKFVAMMLEFKTIIQGGKTWKQNEQDVLKQQEMERRQKEYFEKLAKEAGASDGAKDSSGKPRVLITGINGYVGSQICMAFLKHGGFSIRGTLRNKSDPKKFNEVLKAFGKDYLSTIELVDMELMDVPSIQRAVKGCDYIVHSASPNPSKAPKDEQSVIRPAVQGTVAIL